MKNTTEQKKIAKLKDTIKNIENHLDLEMGKYNTLYALYKDKDSEVDSLKKELKESQSQSRKLLSLLLKLEGE